MHIVLLPAGRPGMWGRDNPLAPSFCSYSRVPRTMARVWVPGLRERPRLGLRQHCHVTPCHEAKSSKYKL